MKLSEIEKIIDRIKRLSGKIEKIELVTEEWSYKFPDGNETFYCVQNIRDQKQLADEISNIFIWLWNIKDYLKEHFKASSLDPNDIEEYVNNNFQLCLSADIANKLKHGRLKNSRSKLFPELGNAQFEFDSSAMSALTFSGNRVEVDVEKPAEVEYRIPVLDKDKKEICEGLQLASEAINLWEKLFNTLQKDS